MTELYRRHGSAPAELPAVTHDETGNAYTAPYADADLAMLGYEIAPPRPDDTDAQTAEWDASAEAWAMFDRPPPPPVPPPPPIVLTAGTLFFERMTDEEYDDLDASVRAGETARVYRGWVAATSFIEGTAMWALLDKHLSLVVLVARKAELLARPADAALTSNDALAA